MRNAQPNNYASAEAALAGACAGKPRFLAIALLLALGAALSISVGAGAQSYLEADRRGLAAPWGATEEPWSRALDEYRGAIREREAAERLDQTERRLDELEREAARERWERDWERTFGPPYD